MESHNSIKSFLLRQNEFVKITAVAALTVFITFLAISSNDKRVNVADYENDMGEIISSKPCTKNPGNNQCEIYKDKDNTKFSIQEQFTTIVSKEKGSTTCCLTVSSTTIGGEVTKASQSCWTTSKDLPACPSGYTKKIQ